MSNGLPEFSEEDWKKFRNIYDNAPKRREITNSMLSEGQPYSPLDLKTESSKLEKILQSAGWKHPTVTEGIKLRHKDGFLIRCEVIADGATDYYAELVTSSTLETGELVRSSKKSPW